MAGCCDSHDIARLGKALARPEWTETLRFKVQGDGVKPGRPAVRQITAKSPLPALRDLKLTARNENPAGKWLSPPS
jgi:hypothetical protein